MNRFSKICYIPYRCNKDKARYFVFHSLGLCLRLIWISYPAPPSAVVALGSVRGIILPSLAPFGWLTPLTQVLAQLASLWTESFRCWCGQSCAPVGARTVLFINWFVPTAQGLRDQAVPRCGCGTPATRTASDKAQGVFSYVAHRIL